MGALLHKLSSGLHTYTIALARACWGDWRASLAIMTLAALPQGLGPIPTTHVEAHSPLQVQLRGI